MLGAAIGKDSYIKSFVSEKVDGWVSEIERLAHYAESQPHAAFAALTHGLTSKWSYLCRATPSISSFIPSLEDSLRTKLIPMLTGKEPPNDTERDLALPVRLGGLGIRNPVRAADEEYCASIAVSTPFSQTNYISNPKVHR